MIPEQLHQKVELLLGKPVHQLRSVSGGSINHAATIITEDNQTYFLKWNSSAASDMFAKEEKGLQLLRSADCNLRIPEVTGSGSTEEETDFLVIEYIREGSADSHSSEVFGKELASLHRHTAKEYGLDHDNYIGKLPQSNTKHKDWIDFFIAERLQPQLQQALDAGKLSVQTETHFQNLFKKLPGILTDEPASLLHGDLWGGNYFFDTNGQPVVYDPAVYYGNREIEIAFTHLFGGFSSGFYRSYNEKFPLQPEFSERKDIYNLYPLLVHTNLFGASYARQVQSIVKQF